VIISEQDKNHIHHPKKHKIHVIPNGVDESFFEDLKIEKKYDLIFTGNFSYAPNVSAALFLVNKIMPELQKRNLHLTLLLAGASPDREVQNLASEKVIVTGWVDDIRESYQSARFFVAPLFIGTGLQNKLLEAMASNLPCLTTPLVNNALGGTDGKNILLAEDLNEFVEKIVTYKTELDSFNEISHNGQQFVLKNYSWQTQNSKLLLLFSSSPF
jgi:glycosyltransferase involved in cell wall biosynthesis